jgi:hypothetical protein
LTFSNNLQLTTTNYQLPSNMKYLFVLLAILPLSLLAQFTQSGNKLVGTGAIGSSVQGYNTAISGDGQTIVVGGFGDDGNVGAVWIYIKTPNGWVQQSNKMVGTGALGFANQGRSVAISADGNTVAVGGYTDNGGIGAVWVFVRLRGAWQQEGQKLIGTGGIGATYQGASVSLSGDGNTLLVGGYGDNGGLGATWVFTRFIGEWSQMGSKLTGSGAIASAFQGARVALSANGNTAAIGGYGDNRSRGAMWIFNRMGNTWQQEGTKLIGIGAVNDTVSGAGQGRSVSLSADGNTAIMGGPIDNVSIGAAWVFTRTAGLWSQQSTKLVGTGAAGASGQGIAVSLSADGNTAIVGAHTDNSNTGAAWIYKRTGGLWTQVGNKLVGTGASGTLGYQGISVSISADGNTALVGSPGDAGGPGAVWVYSRIVSSVEEIQNRNDILVYPNPSKGVINYELQSTTAVADTDSDSCFIFRFSNHQILKTVSIIDIQGRKVLERPFKVQINKNAPSSQHFELDASDLPKGLYFIKIETFIGKLVIE